MSYVNVSAWGRRRRSHSSYDPPEPKAFSYSDFNQLMGTVDLLGHTQLGHLRETYTADELRQLFCPEQHREALNHVYRVERPTMAAGEIYIDLKKFVDGMPPILEGTKGICEPKTIVMRVQFNRDNMPDGFVTPEPIFGSIREPMTTLRGMPPADLYERFVTNMRLITHVAGEWAAVKWVLVRLQKELTTPQQVRYVWPAIYTLATEAKIGCAASLAEPSARAGNNASVPSDLLPFLKPTYEVVARSVLLGTNGDVADNYRQGQLRLAANTFSMTDGVTAFEVNGS